jgi:hypothetical protein
MVLLVRLEGADGTARFGAVVEDDHAEARVTRRVHGRLTGRWRGLLPADPGLTAVLRLTMAVLAVTIVLQVLR